ncbi:MAG: site-specific DNA-methyltransferase, partial [Actinomycetota bacterium]|nr:site-specific DNA-methyltransferase [Actinomycetota bacterium]
LQDRLNLLLRGEIIWQKATGAGGSCAWGSFQSAANPVLRDVTERVIVASKGRFDRAMSRRQRQRKGLPSEGSIFKDDFMEATLDLWDIPPESATKVGHPAPFPVELPKRLIELYTYRHDLVLDPFMGSGSTAVAAVHADRHFVGYETNEAYVEAARRRVDEERARISAARQRRLMPQVVLPAVPVEATAEESFQSRAVREGQRAKEIAYAVLRDCNFVDITEDQRFASGVEVNFVARDAEGRRWFFDVSGAFSSTRAGLRRTDTLWKALGKAAVLRSATQGSYRLVFLTTDMPPVSSAGHAALKAARGDVYHDAIQMLSLEGQQRLIRYAGGEGYDEPLGELMSSQADADDA